MAFQEYSWKRCIKEGFVIEAESNPKRANEIFALAELRYEFWCKEQDKKYFLLKIEAYYEIIKELLFALLANEGFKCSNHLCLVEYFKEKFPEKNYEFRLLNELRKARNDINYHGTKIPKSFLEKNELEFKHIIKFLKRSI